MTKPLFTITFTPEQAVDFIKQQIKDNYSSLDDFDVVIKNDANVVIQQKTIPDVKLENPWLIPDADGWFTHDPKYQSVEVPEYIDGDRDILVVHYDGYTTDEDGLAKNYCWAQGENPWDIVKWKYAD